VAGRACPTSPCCTCRPAALQPCSPELNPVETVWAHLRSNMLSNRVFDTRDDITLACSDAWNWLAAQPDRITSTQTRTWAYVSQ